MEGLGELKIRCEGDEKDEKVGESRQKMVTKRRSMWRHIGWWSMISSPSR
jgi:hypothetical protein